MRSALLALALLAPLPVMADGHQTDWAPDLDISMPTLDDAVAIRRHFRSTKTREAQPYQVAYGKDVTFTIDLGRLSQPFFVTRHVTKVLNCDDYIGKPTTLPTDVPLDQKIAATYCGSPTLERAPFLR
jgi:hypothetical protein